MSWVLLFLAFISLVVGMATEVTGKATWAIVTILVGLRVLLPLGLATLAAWVYVS